MTIRQAVAGDEDALLEVDRAAWAPYVSPAWDKPTGPFFNERTTPESVWVAAVDGRVVGYAKMNHPTPLPASEHVWHVNGLAVHPSAEGRGIGRALMERLIEEASARGGRRITLRVFGPNERARRLYERLGFVCEGVFREEFKLSDGTYIDDLFLARSLDTNKT